MVQTMQSSHHVTYIAPAKTQLKINCGCVIHISCDETGHIFSCINDSIYIAVPENFHINLLEGY